MGATSVSGKGLGVGRGKGPKNGRTEYVPLLTPHIVTAGYCTTSGAGTVTVTFPAPLVGAASNYVVIATPAAGSTAARVTTTTDSDGNFSAFTLTGAVSTAHGYMVSTAGMPFVE